MRLLTDFEILACWEDGLDRGPVHRSLRLLSSAMPEMPYDTIASLSIGERDSFLFSLRLLMAGDLVDCISICPSCGEHVEFIYRITGMTGLRQDPGGKSMIMEKDGYTIRFRLPTSNDLLACAAEGGTPADEALFRKCIIAADGPYGSIAAGDIPGPVRDAVLNRMEELDPLADVRVGLACTACGHAWEEHFDIGAILWHETGARARAVMQDVHELARVYGWTEKDILTMSPARRLRYREMIGS